MGIDFGTATVSTAATTVAIDLLGKIDRPDTCMWSVRFPQGSMNKRGEVNSTGSCSYVQHALRTISDGCEMKLSFQGHVENVMHLKCLSTPSLPDRSDGRVQD